MKTMALNSVQNNQSSEALTQFSATIIKAITEYGKNENLVTTVVMICAMIVMIGVALMSVITMVVGGAAFIVSLAPAMIIWSKEDYNRDI